tara:strand:- start:122 stop:589 length:468 start_codon:yes stop_codon:yes gene_type:complete
MKITKKILENIIKEELKALAEQENPISDTKQVIVTILKHFISLEVSPKLIPTSMKKDAIDALEKLRTSDRPDGAPVNMRMTGGLDASLEEIVREEVEKILEQGIDPVVGKPVTLGGQRISREEAFRAFEAELSKMHDPEVVSKFMEALEERLSGI